MMESQKQRHKRWQKALNETVFTRDAHRCLTCGAPAVDAHHITDRHELPNGGYVLENGISLCAPCHVLAECPHQGLATPKL